MRRALVIGSEGNIETAPGNDGVRLRSVRVVREGDSTVDSIDVRKPVGVEIAFDIVKQKYRFLPNLVLHDEHGAHIFSSFDTDPAWREPRQAGRYRSTVWIPGNLLNEGTMIVTVALGALVSGGKGIKFAHAPDAVAFHVYDPGEGGSARGDYVGTWSAPVRPLLRWTTEIQETTSAPR